MVSHSENNMESIYNNHENEEEDFPKYTTKELRDRFEKTIEEAAPPKTMKARVPKSELCTTCRRRVYPMDGLIVDKKKYHKSCFCCEHCRNKLSVGNYVSLHGHFYCHHHYRQLLKSKGHYDNGLVDKPPITSAIQLDETQDWRYSISSLSPADNKTRGGEKNESKTQGNKISVVWPPHADSPKKAFKLEDDIQLAKPQWPPPDSSPKSCRRRDAVPKSIL